MELSEYARMILQGGRLEEKLQRPASFSDSRPGSESIIPAHPKRSPLISLYKKRASKNKFPSKGSLHLPENRGRVLHFFANHELLALELMALVLLKFPKAPKPFRLGIAQTMLEEQEHLQLYLSRMNQLGIGFGDEYLNDFFWKCIANVKSPLEFTAKMSLTLEQGNLDFSFYYWKLFETLEDRETSDILKQVYQDEIGHVKHGLHWFRKFKDQEDFKNRSDWEVYSKLLSKPLSPIRAKGSIFVKEARIDAGLDSEFIDQIEFFQGSKGRPPSIWLFNPNFEEEVIFPNKTFPRTKSLSADLTNILLCLTNEHDLLVTEKPPSDQFLLSLRKLGFKTPQFVTPNELQSLSGPISRIKPWGWSSKIFTQWSKRHQMLTEEHRPDKEWLRSACYEKVPLKKLTSKAWAVATQREFIDSLSQELQRQFPISACRSYICHTFQEFRSAYTNLKAEGFHEVLVKGPYGSSGRHQRKLSCLAPLLENEANWIRNTLSNQKLLIVEPYLDRCLDLSVQLMINNKSSSSILGVTRFLNHKNRSYFGHLLGHKFFNCDKGIVRALYQKNSLGLSNWDLLQKCAQYTIEKLQEQGYTGPAGIDAFIYRYRGHYFLRPVVEINCRYTMGHCALALEKYIPKDWLGLFSIKSKEHLQSPVHSIESFFLLDKLKTLNGQTINLKKSPTAGRVLLNDPQNTNSLIASFIMKPLS